MTFTKLALF